MLNPLFGMNINHLLSFFLVLFLSYSGTAQHPDDNIGKSLNSKYLEHLIKTGIDSVRTAHQLLPVVNDSILYLAAQHHANYLEEIGKLSHLENNTLYKTPTDRANHFGAVNYQVYENIAYTYYNVPLKDKKGKKTTAVSYQQLANQFVIGWVNSPGHYQNIITPNIEITGLAIKKDKNSNRVYAVQKFAEVLFKYSFTEPKHIFPYSDYQPLDPIQEFPFTNSFQTTYPYGLKASSKSSDELKNINQVIEKLSGYRELEVDDNNNVWIKMYLQAEHLLNFIETNQDGLAIEVIKYKPYDCGNPAYYTWSTRRNQASELSDTLLLPVFRKKLMRGFKPKRKSTLKRIKKELKKKESELNLYQKIMAGIRLPYTPDKFKYKLAKLPKNMEGYNEINLVFIKDNEIVRVSHFSDVCGEHYEEFHPVAALRSQGSFEYIPVAPIKEYEFDFHFKKGKTDYKYEDLKPVLDSLTDDEFIVLNAKIHAFSSVEGSEKINLALQERRANNIIKAFQSKQSSIISPTISTTINWPLFYEQIDSNPELIHLKGLPQSALKDSLLNKKFTAKNEQFLAEQRIAKVQISTKYNLNSNTLQKFIFQEYEHYIQKIEQLEEGETNDFEQLLDTLLAIQEYCFQQVLLNNLPENTLHLLKHTAKKGTMKLYVNHWYYLDYFKVPIAKRSIQWESLESYSQLNSFVPVGAYNYMIKAIENWDPKTNFNGAKDEEVLSVFYNLQYAFPDSTQAIENLQINYWFKNADHHFNRDNWVKKEEYLLRIYKYYAAKQKLSVTKIIKLAKYFIELKSPTLAQGIISRYSGELNKELKILSLKLDYFNSIEYHSDAYASSLLEARSYLSQSEWCGLFVGDCNISFQVFDAKVLRDFYCEECRDFKNYAQQPEKWPQK